MAQDRGAVLADCEHMLGGSISVVIAIMLEADLAGRIKAVDDQFDVHYLPNRLDPSREARCPC